MRDRIRGCCLIAVVTALAGISSAPRPAAANTYSVYACADATPNDVNHSWIPYNADPSHIEIGQDCPGSGRDAQPGLPGSYSGVHVENKLNAPGAVNGPGGGWTFTAPAGTKITSLSYSRYLGEYDDPSWVAALTDATGATVAGETCSITIGACSVGAPGGSRRSIALSTKSLSLSLLCTATGGATCTTGTTIHNAWAAIYAATVTLDDPQPPGFAAFPTGTLADSSAWYRGTQTTSWSGTDNAGIAKARVLVDGASVPASTVALSCDYTYTQPCPGATGHPSASGTVSLDTSAFSDGAHSVQVQLEDAGHNTVDSGTVTVHFDNHAPDAPTAMSGDDDAAGWRARPDFALHVTAPGQGSGAPVAAAHWQLCRTASDCDAPQTSSDPTTISGTVPGEGEWTIKVWLEDAAGNASPANASEARVAYDRTPPPPLTSLGAYDSGPTFRLSWGEPAPDGGAPWAATRWQACQGSTCLPVREQPAGDNTATFTAPSAGTWTIRAWMVDAAGNADPATARATTAVYRPGGTTQPPPPDYDGDGVPDLADSCISIPAHTANGCPLAPSDHDRDGVPDTRDRCPTRSARTATGCPALRFGTLRIARAHTAVSVTGTLAAAGSDTNVTVSASAAHRGTVRRATRARTGRFHLSMRLPRRLARAPTLRIAIHARSLGRTATAHRTLRLPKRVRDSVP